MSSQKTGNTKHELAVRRLIHSVGLRYRIHYPLPGLRRRSIDIAFPAKRLAVFIDGCFWHGCEVHRTIPASNREAWAEKISVNQLRDQETDDLLGRAGWAVLRFWEHAPAHEIADAICCRLCDPGAGKPRREG